MISLKKFSGILLLVTITGLLFWLNSCAPDDPFILDPDAKTKDTATTLSLKFTNIADNTISYGSGYDPDGSGPKPVSIVNTITLKTNSEYLIDLEYLDDTDPFKPRNLNDTVVKYKTDYIICGTTTTSGTIIPTDNDGTFPLGLQHRIKTFSSSTGVLSFVLRYQKGIKDGGCTAGTVMLALNFPLKIQ